MFKKTTLALAVCSLFATLSGCGSDSIPASVITPTPAPIPAPAPAPVPAPTISMTVTPSLGKVLNADVMLKRLDGSVLATQSTGSKGSASFTGLADNLGPLLVEVVGSASATYFDEAKGTMLPFASGQVMRAAVDAARANADIGVSALTTAAAARAGQLAGGMTAANIVAANAAIASTFGVADILLAPSLVASAADLSALPNTAAGQYALKLAALAKAADTQNNAIAAPALAMLDAMAKDLSDGSFDGKNGATALANLPYNVATFITQWLNAAQSFGLPNFASYLNAANFAVMGAGTAPVAPTLPVTPTLPPTPTPPSTVVGGPPPVGTWWGVGVSLPGDCMIKITSAGDMTMQIGVYSVTANYSGPSPDAFHNAVTVNSWDAVDDVGGAITMVSASFTKDGALQTAMSAKPGAAGVSCFNFKKF